MRRGRVGPAIPQGAESHPPLAVIAASVLRRSRVDRASRSSRVERLRPAVLAPGVSGRAHPRGGLNALVRDVVGGRNHVDPAVAAINRPAVSFEPAMKAIGNLARLGRPPLSQDDLPALGEALMMKIEQQRGRDAHAVTRVGRPVPKRSGEARQPPLTGETADQLGRGTAAIKAFRLRDDDGHPHRLGHGRLCRVASAWCRDAGGAAEGGPNTSSRSAQAHRRSRPRLFQYPAAHRTPPPTAQASGGLTQRCNLGQQVGIALRRLDHLRGRRAPRDLGGQHLPPCPRRQERRPGRLSWLETRACTSRHTRHRTHDRGIT